jgi:hypothetical protein
MSFGDWELFRMVVVSLREQELTVLITQEEGPRSVRFVVDSDERIRKGSFIVIDFNNLFSLKKI